MRFPRVAWPILIAAFASYVQRADPPLELLAASSSSSPSVMEVIEL